MSTAHSDEEARAQAAQAVEQGTTLIREHLASHMHANPNSSYVTWISTLHPENASVTIDTRFLIPGNPWWTAYEDCKPGMPSAVAIPVDDNGQGQSAGAEEYRKPHFCQVCSPVVLITGASLALAAFLAVNIIEIIATCIYFISAALFHMSKYIRCLRILYYIFAMVDSILLMTSVLVAEFLAGSAFIFIIIFGGHLAACNWHQYIRRICHASRHLHRKTCNPPRQLMLCCCRCSNVAPAVPTATTPTSLPTTTATTTYDEEDISKGVTPAAVLPTIAVVPTAPPDIYEYEPSEKLQY